MKARRRIAFPKAQPERLSFGNYSRDLQPGEWGSMVTLQSSNPETRMSHLGQKATYATQQKGTSAQYKTDGKYALTGSL
jgi:hypothetical protein